MGRPLYPFFNPVTDHALSFGRWFHRFGGRQRPSKTSDGLFLYRFGIEKWRRPGAPCVQRKKKSVIAPGLITDIVIFYYVGTQTIINPFSP
jgi:hypothetical protein